MTISATTAVRLPSPVAQTSSAPAATATAPSELPPARGSSTTVSSDATAENVQAKKEALAGAVSPNQQERWKIMKEVSDQQWLEKYGPKGSEPPGSGASQPAPGPAPKPAPAPAPKPAPLPPEVLEKQKEKWKLMQSVQPPRVYDFSR